MSCLQPSQHQGQQGQGQRLQQPPPSNQTSGVPRGMIPCTNARHDPTKGGNPLSLWSWSHAHWATTQGGGAGVLEKKKKKK